ncbi:MAG: hypothetical protein EAX90_11260 [Candidatus Heimdallarchaeota archaeon]|nr:hypothetical protein [Candidatus Heimdallarchaeota archaeon]
MSEKTPDVKEPLATFKQRALAGLVPDFLVPVLLVICGSVVLAFASDAFMIVGGVVCQLCAILTFIGSFIFLPYKRRGQTNGKARQHITTKKIVNKETWELRDLGEGDIGLIIGRAIVNWIEIFLIIPVLVPYLMISSSNNNQTLTDRIFGTVVVQVDPEEYGTKKIKEDKTDEPAKTTKTKETTPKTSTRTDFEESNTIAIISKFVLIGGSILPIVYFLLMGIHSLIVTISFSINVWGGFWPFTGIIFSKVVHGFGIVSYICFFLITAAIFLLAIQYSDKIRTTLFITGGLFVVFIIFWIIAYEANWTVTPLTLVNGNLVSVAVGNIIFWLFAMISLIVSLFFFNKYIKQVNEEHEQEIPTFKGHIVMIVISTLRLIVFIIGVATVPDLAFGATIYYLYKVIGWFFIFTLLGIFGGFIFKGLKFNNKKIPTKEDK